MWSKDTKGKGKEGKSGGESSNGSSKTTAAELRYGAATLAWALETIGVTKYGFIGGGAVSFLSAQYGLPTRQTKYLDLIVQPTTTISADLVSRSLTTNETVKEYFVSMREDYVDKPHVVVMRANKPIYIAIEIFDWQLWPDRQQYYNLDWGGNAPQTLVVGDRQTPLLGTGWLLRQKILTFAQRNKKRETDMEDVAAFREILALRRETITITDDGEVVALKAVLDSPDCPDLKGWVRCEAVWPTEWTWDARRKDYYRYDELWSKVWGKASK